MTLLPECTIAPETPTAPLPAVRRAVPRIDDEPILMFVMRDAKDGKFGMPGVSRESLPPDWFKVTATFSWPPLVEGTLRVIADEVGPLDFEATADDDDIDALFRIFLKSSKALVGGNERAAVLESPLL